MTAICNGCEYEYYDEKTHQWRCKLFDEGRKDECPDVQAERTQAWLDRRGEEE